MAWNSGKRGGTDPDCSGKGSDQTIKAGSRPHQAPAEQWIPRDAKGRRHATQLRSPVGSRAAGVSAVGCGDDSPSQPAHCHSPQDALQELPEAAQCTHALHQSRQPLRRSARIDVGFETTGAGRAHPALRPRLPPQPVGSSWQTPATSVDAVRQGPEYVI
jgi:hypothetical protein